MNIKVLVLCLFFVMLNAFSFASITTKPIGPLIDYIGTTHHSVTKIQLVYHFDDCYPLVTLDDGSVWLFGDVMGGGGGWVLDWRVGDAIQFEVVQHAGRNHIYMINPHRNPYGLSAKISFSSAYEIPDDAFIGDYQPIEK